MRRVSRSEKTMSAVIGTNAATDQKSTKPTKFANTSVAGRLVGRFGCDFSGNKCGVSERLVLNSTQVAELLHCSVRSVEDHARTGLLPGYKVGDGWIFLPDMVIDAIRVLALEEAEKRKSPKPKYRIDPIAVANTPKTKRVPAGMEHLTAAERESILKPVAVNPGVH